MSTSRSLIGSKPCEEQASRQRTFHLQSKFEAHVMFARLLTCAPRISIDVIERAKTPTREEALAARLKRLRSHDGSSASSPSVKPASPFSEKSPANVSSASYALPKTPTSRAAPPESRGDQEAVDDSVFYTDDSTLQGLLEDVGADDSFAAAAVEPQADTGPSDEQVKALLEELSRSVPQNEASPTKGPHDEQDDGSDDSDGDGMRRDVDDVMAKFKDEAELDKARETEPADTHEGNEEEDEEEDQSQQGETTSSDTNLTLPSVPTETSQDQPSSSTQPTSMASITARLSALRTASSSSDPDPDASLSLPSVPSSRPHAADKPVKRLTSRTGYTDDDVDGWCTVCLEDAALRCLGCDDDPYCVRCWREMHVGPAAAFDDRSHKAVYLHRDKKEKKVALGA